MERLGIAPTHGVLNLLGSLQSHLHKNEGEMSLRSLLPVYERLLSSRTCASDDESTVMPDLQRIRSALKSQADLFDVAQTFDDRVDECLRIADENPSSCIYESLRLLVALAGGDDGSTFILRDPTRVQSIRSYPRDATSSTEQALQRRVGERIMMANVDVVAQFHQAALLHSTSLPLGSEAVLGRFDFSSFAPKNARQAALWYPQESDGHETPMGGPASTLPDLFQQWAASSSTATTGVPRLIDLVPLQELNPSANPPNTLSFATPAKQMPCEPTTTKPSPSGVESEVFFFDATQVVKVPQPLQKDDGSATEASWGEQEDDDDSHAMSWSRFVREPLTPATWEQLGEQETTMAKPRIVPLTTQPVLQRALTPAMCQAQPSSLSIAAVEIQEADIFADTVKALCGIESVLFRRSIPLACLRIPTKIRFKLHTASSTSLRLMLEQFRRAGTAFMRLEFLSVYFMQDPSRGGKTVQAMADALRVYLSAYQQLVSKLEDTQSPSHAVSLIALLSKTRVLRHQILCLSEALGVCSESDGFVFWKLLSGGEFPRGVALLNQLHEKLRETEREDTDGKLTRLFQWLLVRTAAPFVALLSCYVASGQTPLELDPHSEFRLSVYSTLQGFDDLASDSKALTTGLVPTFLSAIHPNVVEIGRLQLLLCSILPQTDMLPTDHLRLGNRATEAQIVLDQTRQFVVEMAKRVEAACSNHTVSLQATRRPLRSPSKSPRHDDTINDEWVANKRKRFEQKRKDQQSQRDMLDEMVQSQRARRLANAEQERRKDEQTAIDQLEEEKAQLQKGKELLLAKYTPLLEDADNRHRYMKWRRDRAVRLSETKDALLALYAAEAQAWVRVDTARTVADSQQLLEQSLANGEDGGGGDTAMEDSSKKDGGPVVVVAVGAADWGDRTAGVSTSAGISNDDGGLFWKPRMRVQRVPGGGGHDAMAALYPDHESESRDKSPALMPTKLGTAIVAKPNGGGGSDAYESIYGRSQDATAALALLQAAHETESEKRNAAVSVLRTGAELVDVTMEDVDATSLDDTARASNGNQTEDDDTTSTFDNGHQHGDLKEHRIEENKVSVTGRNPALALLRSPTHFLQDHVSPDDHAILQSVLELNPTTSASPSALVPFQTLARLSLEEPVTLVHKYLDRMALQAVVVKLDLKTHLRWLQRIALMSEGLCMDMFARDLLLKMRSETRVFLALPGRLSTMLALAMIEARLVATSTRLPPFEYQIAADGFVAAVATGSLLPCMADVVEQLTLNYATSLHLTTIITPQAMGDYLCVHRFLLHTRLTEQETKEIWMAWRKSRLRDNTQSPGTRRQCDLVLHFAQAFLNAFHEAFTSQVLGIRWNELLQFVDQAQSVSQLRSRHEGFVKDARSCCFLQTDHSEILQTVRSILDGVWTLGRLIRSIEAHDGALDALQSQLQSVSEAQACGLRRLLTQLYRLETTHESCVREFAKHLIARLNLNGFFPDTTVGAGDQCAHHLT